MPGGLQNKIKSINSPEIRSVNIVVVLKLNMEVTIPTGPPQRGLSIDVNAGGVSVGVSTLRPDAHHFGEKSCHSFFNPPRVKLPGFLED